MRPENCKAGALPAELHPLADLGFCVVATWRPGTTGDRGATGCVVDQRRAVRGERAAECDPGVLGQGAGGRVTPAARTGTPAARPMWWSSTSPRRADVRSVNRSAATIAVACSCCWTLETAARTCHPTRPRRFSPDRSSSMSFRPRWPGPEQLGPPSIPPPGPRPSCPGRPSPAGPGPALAVAAARLHSLFLG